MSLENWVEYDPYILNTDIKCNNIEYFVNNIYVTVTGIPKNLDTAACMAKKT